MRNRVLLLAAQAGLLGLSVTFLIVPASALFLDRYGADELPFVYIAVAVLGVVVSRVIRSMQARLSLVAVATWCIGAFVVIVAVSWVLLRFAGQIWVSAVLVGLFPLAIPVGFVLVGTQAGRLLDVRTMKQSFARIVAGFSLGFVVGGLATTALIGPLGGPVDLLLVDVVIGAAYLWTAIATGRRFPAELGERPRPEPPRSAAPPAERSAPPRQGLFVMIFGYQLLAAAVTQLLDYVVWERAAYHFPDPSELARFQGLFGTLINVFALAFVFLVAGRLLVRYGERGGLSANPLGLAVLLLVSTVVGVTAGEGATAFFVAVCAQQVAHIALIDGMTRAAINTAYQALDPSSRLRAQTVVEAAGVPIAVGFVGVLLLVFRFTRPRGPRRGRGDPGPDDRLAGRRPARLSAVPRGRAGARHRAAVGAARPPRLRQRGGERAARQLGRPRRDGRAVRGQRPASPSRSEVAGPHDVVRPVRPAGRRVRADRGGG